MKKFLKEFRDFAFKGNVMDLAVGVMIGGAFNKIVTSLVNDLFMPLLSLLIGRFNLGKAFLVLDGQAYESAAAAVASGAVVLNYGAFLSTGIDFLVMALVIFLTIRVMGRILPKVQTPAPKPSPRLCPYCMGEIHESASRCCHCTAQLSPGPEESAPPAQKEG